MTKRELEKLIKSEMEKIYQSQDQWLIRRLTIIYSQIDKNIKNGMNADKAIKSAFRDTHFEAQFIEKIKTDIVNGAILGSGIIEYDKVKTAKRIELEKALMNTTWTKDRVPLSERLHSNIQNSIGYIKNAVNQSLKDGQGVRQIALELFDGYGYGQKLKAKGAQYKIKKDLYELAKMRINGTKVEDIAPEELNALKNYIENKLILDKPWNSKENARNTALKQSYENLIEAIESGTEKEVSKALWVAIQEKSRYNALRIARTELARAHYDGFIAETMENEDITLIRFSLSANHKILDICDFHTGLDIGYGAGVYPKNQTPPYPFHPHCRCTFTDYIKPNVKKVPKEVLDESAKKWLKDNPNLQHPVLGSFDRVDAFEKGANPFSQMREFKGYEEPQSRIKNILQAVEV